MDTILQTASPAYLLTNCRIGRRRSAGFWLVSRLLEMDEKTTLKTWTVMETLLGSIAFLIVLILSVIL
jgi:H+/gluconate symporter-like permease